MEHISREELLSRLDTTDGDAVRAIETESMVAGLKRYRETPAEQKGPRRHTDDELYYVLSGTGTIEVGDETCSVAAGDLLAIEAGQRHDVLAVDDDLLVLKVFAETD